MIRINASISKKVPGNEQFSSQQYGASIDVELGEGGDAMKITEKIRRLYAVLHAAVEEQIIQARRENGNGGSNGDGIRRPVIGRSPRSNGRRVPASQAQCKAVFAICKSKGLDMAEALQSFGVDRPDDLTVQQASEVISALKQPQ